jgi:UDP-N-acetylglucosamine 2-epimerase (non-hydrolysing)/GDP/UDP-N,N'-diacetylbacillosamine 2-epimerase (hydrolysing)
MHLTAEFGYTVKEIEKDGFKIDSKINVLHHKDTGTAMAKCIGQCLARIADSLEKIRPDILLVLGDRSEMLAGAIAATYMGIPVAHIHGGDISGNVDEPVRHAITKIAHIHFPATKESAERIIKMGEEPWRVHVVGAPGLDLALNAKLPEPRELARKYSLDLSKPILLVVQHSVVTEAESASSQIRETLDAIVELGYQTVLVYPNADAGGRRMIEVIKEYGKYSFIKAFKSIAREEFLGLMKLSSVMVGNSSSGIIEAPSFGLPVVNIGTRQMGRQRAENVIDVDYDREEIKEAIRKTLFDERFKEKARNCKNFYGDGKAGIRIANILVETEINRRLLEKRMMY